MGGKRARGAAPCWRGKDDPAPFVPGLPEEVPRARSLKGLFEAMACCTRCELALGRTQVVIGSGKKGAELMLIGEAPGAEEDRQGVPFVGASGRMVERMLIANGLTREEVYITNIAACRPPGNRAPKPREILAHTPWLEEQIRLVRPRAIMTLGRTAFTYFFKGAKITQLRGTIQKVMRDERDIPLLPTYHPAAALRNRELLPDLEADFARIPALLRDAPRR
jgi:uracil-DNA glycosylase